MNDGPSNVTGDILDIQDQAKDSDVILMHDMADNIQTVEAVRTLIPALKERGFEYCTTGVC